MGDGISNWRVGAIALATFLALGGNAKAIATQQAQAYTDNVLPAQNAAAFTPLDAHTAVIGSETAHVVAHGNPAIIPNSVAWHFPAGWAVANAGSIFGGATDYFPRPFGPATTGAHAGLVTVDNVANTGAVHPDGEGDTANDTGGNLATAA